MVDMERLIAKLHTERKDRGRVSLYVSRPLWKELGRNCAKLDVSVSRVIEELIELFNEKFKTAKDT